ncbi:hypothetical protein L6452_32383 [Arctium lappa]|uniref:Uncharacterized protein n=1 Tax=Arctium lappa TaxID=4217 RepID=A0ACB8Z525_ARCLA|nr:hypothetical protein L6452_32383 [Arctium lappa]
MWRSKLQVGDGFEGCGEKQKLSVVEARPAISSHELMISGGGLDLSSGNGLCYKITKKEGDRKLDQRSPPRKTTVDRGTLSGKTKNISDLRSTFEVLDIDCDRKISRDDLKTSYADANDDVICTMMTVYNSNQNGYDEFKKVLRSNNKGNDGVMEDVFKADGDGDIKVGYGDLKSYFLLTEFKVNDDEIKAMIRLGSVDGHIDGVSFEGFLKILVV